MERERSRWFWRKLGDRMSRMKGRMRMRDRWRVASRGWLNVWVCNEGWAEVAWDTGC